MAIKTPRVPLSSLFWLPIAQRSRTLADQGIYVTWYMRPHGALIAFGPALDDGAMFSGRTSAAAAGRVGANA